MSKRVALIGNMNNNHFALMRYLRDLGVDAHLFIFDKEAEHFHPRCDTWEYEKWAANIHKLPFTNGGHDILWLRGRTIRKEIDGYDCYIGNGISPVLFSKMGRMLDIFIPYGEGVEFIIEHEFKYGRPFASLFSLLRKTMMETSLRKSVKYVVTANLHAVSLNTYSRLNIDPVIMPIPMLYVEQKTADTVLPTRVKDAVKRMQQSSLVVFSHVSHIWKTLPVSHFMGGVGKNNNWLIQGFADYLRKSSNTDALLCFVEYGRDVNASKLLINELKIGDNVCWLPQMDRREIMCLLPNVDLGGGEFAGMYWGGCGWEFLASGIPMLHQLTAPEEYESTDLPLPPFFNVQSPQEISQVLLDNNRESLQTMGNICKKWFAAYQGHSLAKRYVDLIGQT